MTRKISAHISIAGGLVNAIKNIKEINGNCIQIFAGSPRMWTRRLYSEDETKRLNQLLDEHNLRPIFIHALYLVNLATDKPDLLQKSYTALLTDMKNADAINSAGVIVHIGSHQGRGFKQVVNQITLQIQNLLKQTKTAPFIIENSAGQKGKVGSLEEIKALIDALGNSPRLKVCLDTAHLFEAGHDLRETDNINKLVQKLKKLQLLSKLVCIHLNDSKTELNSRQDNHENLGDGYIGLRSLKNFINHPDLKHLPLILEVPGLDNKGPDAHNISLAQKL
jgi:deoxyribonuclease-4